MVEMRELQAADLDTAASICDEQLGLGYLTGENHIVSEYNYGLFLNGELASCCLAAIQDKEAANLLVGFDRFLASTLFIHTIATAEKFKNKGFATLVVKEVVQLNRTKYTFATAWQGSNQINVEGVLTRCGLSKECELKRYYFSDPEPHQCPNCGIGNRCVCSAWLFVKHHY